MAVCVHGHVDTALAKRFVHGRPQPLALSQTVWIIGLTTCPEGH